MALFTSAPNASKTSVKLKLLCDLRSCPNTQKEMPVTRPGLDENLKHTLLRYRMSVIDISGNCNTPAKTHGRALAMEVEEATHELTKSDRKTYNGYGGVSAREEALQSRLALFVREIASLLQQFEFRNSILHSNLPL